MKVKSHTLTFVRKKNNTSKHKLFVMSNPCLFPRLYCMIFVTRQSFSPRGTIRECHPQRVMSLCLLYPYPQHADRSPTRHGVDIHSLKYLLISRPMWSSRSVMCHDKV